ARPARSRVELGLGGKQRQIAARASEGAFAVLVVERAGEGTLCVLLTQHGVLLRREQLPPFLRSMGDLERLGGGVRAAAPPQAGKAGGSENGETEGPQSNLASRHDDSSAFYLDSTRLLARGNSTRAHGRSRPGQQSASRGDLRRGDDDLATHALGREGEPDIALERLAYDGLDHRSAEAGALWRHDRRAAALLPDQLELRRLVAELPLNATRAARIGQRAVFVRVGGELVQRKTEVLNGLGFQHYVLAFDCDLLAEAVGMLAELLLDEHAERRAVPIVGDQEVMRGADGDEPRVEAPTAITDS